MQLRQHSLPRTLPSCGPGRAGSGSRPTGAKDRFAPLFWGWQSLHLFELDSCLTRTDGAGLWDHLAQCPGQHLAAYCSGQQCPGQHLAESLPTHSPWGLYAVHPHVDSSPQPRAHSDFLDSKVAGSKAAGTNAAGGGEPRAKTNPNPYK